MISAIFKPLFMVIITTILAFALFPAFVGAQDDVIDNGLCTGEADKSPICKDIEPGNSNNPVSREDGLFVSVFTVLSIIAGIIAVIILVIGGIQMMTSDGDPQKFTNARNLIIYAVIGILIVVFAQAIVRVIVLSLVE